MAVTVLTGSEDKMARLWDTATGRLIGLPLVHQGPVVAVAFSPDGLSFLTASSDHTVRLWDSNLGQPFGLIAEHPDMGHSVAYSPDSRSILAGDYVGRAKHANAMTGAIIGQTIRHQARVIAVAFSPDGSPCSPAATTGRRSSGMRRPETPSGRRCSTRVGSAWWRTVPMARRS